jgi:hypothetical protein
MFVPPSNIQYIYTSSYLKCYEIFKNLNFIKLFQVYVFPST